ncbi:MAG: acyl-CoA transferase [Betaproteobacteria bacterium RIFCSPLOWO2_12_FULL_62_58]|nr:MAG: acyl-CoA transferase [Betaproteobacteria bacterium RIFCSPLOWO2_12_FULL_62_58]
MQPLSGIRVLDFSTLLPGPLATLILAEAGAEVIKIERPGTGDEMRSYTPKFGADSVNFALLNRGKRSIAIDLKQPGAIERLMPLVKSADVIVEQFRPGVMDRLGLGYEAVARANPRIIYCAITGYGQSGPRAVTAAHDLNYVAESGMLALAAGSDGAPVPPAALVADIGGGSYPAVINILLALSARERSGRGCKLDVAMADNLFAFMYWAMGDGLAAKRWPRPGRALVTGGSPRYQIYRTKDDRFIAAAPLEEKFWQNFCDAIGLPAAARDDSRDPDAVRRTVAECIRARTAEEWHGAFAGKDLCCNVVRSIEEALADPELIAQRLFDAKLVAGADRITALPLPIAAHFRGAGSVAGYPALGEANALLDKDHQISELKRI